MGTQEEWCPYNYYTADPAYLGSLVGRWVRAKLIVGRTTAAATAAASNLSNVWRSLLDTFGGLSAAARGSSGEAVREALRAGLVLVVLGGSEGGVAL